MRPPRLTIRMMMLAVVTAALLLVPLGMRERARRDIRLRMSHDLAASIENKESVAAECRVNAAKSNFAWERQELLDRARLLDRWAKAERLAKRTIPLAELPRQTVQNSGTDDTCN